MRGFVGRCRPVRGIDGHCAEHGVTSMVVKTNRLCFGRAARPSHYRVATRTLLQMPPKQEPYFYVAHVTLSVTRSYKPKARFRERSALRLRGVVATDD